MDHGTPPVIPQEFQQYDSYTEDPKWQIKFSIIWASVAGFFILLALPSVVRAIRKRTAFRGILCGIGESYYRRIGKVEPKPQVIQSEVARKTKKGVHMSMNGVLSRLVSVFYWSPPGIGLNAGQLVLVVGYIVTVILCIVVKAPLVSNSNRAGFMALAQFPVVFLFATKNSILSLLLGPGSGYEKLNFIHRWSGRCMFFGGLIHGSLWINNHLEWDLPIIGQQKETSGVAALGLLCVIVLTSLKPVRKYFYEVFYVIHLLSFVAFFVTVCYHTIYAPPWIFPPLAFFGLDILMRMFKFRIKDAILVPVDKQMTLVHVPHCSDGWTAGQHVRLRVFFSGRLFESHPLTILSAPPSISCIRSFPNGITLGARVMGDWSRALSEYASQATQEARKLEMNNESHDIKIESGDASPSSIPTEVPVQVMLDGPYGGSSVDLGEYESVLLFAGGSGATFTIGVLDDIVGRCVRLGRPNGEKTRRIEFAWCVRSFASIDWFAPALNDIACAAASSTKTLEGGSLSLDLHISIYVTCLCNPEAVPQIPNCDVSVVRPLIYNILLDMITPPCSTSSKKQSSTSQTSPSLDDDEIVLESSSSCSAEDLGLGVCAAGRLPWIGEGRGGLAVCASGPAGLAREAANAVARVQMMGKGKDVGVIGLHTEVYTM